MKRLKPNDLEDQKGAQSLLLTPGPANGGTVELGRLSKQLVLVFRLSARESAVCCLYARGLVEKEIATELKLSDKTIATYLTRAGAKMGCRDRSAIRRVVLECALALDPER